MKDDSASKIKFSKHCDMNELKEKKVILEEVNSSVKTFSVNGISLSRMKKKL